MATLTACEQAAIDLAAYKTALADLLTGKRIIEISHADKRISYYAAGNVNEIRELIRIKQAEVDACNGRVRNRFIHNIPVDY